MDQISSQIRLNHLMTYLESQQTDISKVPLEVLKNINAKINQRGIIPSELDLLGLKRIMQQLNYRKYYEYSDAILYAINGKQLPVIKDADKAKIIAVFTDIVASYKQCCPPDRLGFFNYNYALQKICELIGLTEYLVLFPLPPAYLRNKDKLKHNEKIWKKLCEHNYDKWSEYLYIKIEK